jgi:hypothetical protein
MIALSEGRTYGYQIAQLVRQLEMIFYALHASTALAIHSYRAVLPDRCSRLR